MTAQARIVKRYANRKMYDTERSAYVTLEEIAEMVRAGQEVRIIDNRTKEDLTEVTLAQALVDAERKQRGRLPVEKLKTLLASGGEFLQKRIAQPVTTLREEAERTMTGWRHEAERSIGSWREEAEKRVERILHRGEGHGEADTTSEEREATHVFRGLVDQMATAYEEVQRRLDERARVLTGALTRFSHAEAEITELRRRVDELETRLAAVEGKRGPSDNSPAA